MFYRHCNSKKISTNNLQKDGIHENIEEMFEFTLVITENISKTNFYGK